jgi:hypothetical protein
VNRPYRALAVRFAAVDVACCAAVVAIRLAYENPDTTRIIAAGISACTFLAAFSLLLSAALSFGWHTVRINRWARYEAALLAARPTGPVGRRGYVVEPDPNSVYEGYTPAQMPTVNPPTQPARHAATLRLEVRDGGYASPYLPDEHVAEARIASEMAA